MPAKYSTATIEKVMARWKTGASLKMVGAELGLTVDQVNGLVASARRRGDPRAARRTVKGRKDGRSHDSRGIYHTRAESRSIKEFVLDRWHAGDTTLQISRKIHITHGYADSIVERARKAGDPRAGYR